MDIKIELQDLLISYLDQCDIDDINDIVSTALCRDIWYNREEETIEDLIERLDDKELSEVINYLLDNND